MGKHRAPGCQASLARGVLGVALVVAMACDGGGSGAGTAGIHEGDRCQHLGREARDAYGKTVVCRRDPGDDAAIWKRR